MGSLDEDYRLPPLLEGPSTGTNSWEDLFSLELAPLIDFTPPKPTSHDIPEPNAQKISPLSATSGGDATKPGKGTKSIAPLARVLNEEESPTDDRSPRPPPRKRRKNEDQDTKYDGYVQLPHPEASKSLERTKPPPMIPPLLQGLHEPPPTAGLFPRITDVLPEDGVKQHVNDLNNKERGEFHATKEKAGDISIHDVPESDKHPKSASSHSVQAATRSPKLARRDKSRPQTAFKKRDLSSKQPSLRRSLSAKHRNKWTESETQDLLAGVTRFGVGKWHQILKCDDYSFHQRKAMDLKDRYRVCQKSGLTPSVGVADEADSRLVTDAQVDSSSIGSALVENNTQKSNSAQRRERHPYTEEEDDALLKGIRKYGSQWAKIRREQGLNLGSRTPRDLRDRCRHRFPEQYRSLREEGKLVPTPNTSHAQMKSQKTALSLESLLITSDTREAENGSAGRASRLTPASVKARSQHAGSTEPAAEPAPSCVDPTVTWKPTGLPY